jgi:hypothetical protein
MVKLLKKILNLFKKCRMAKINNITSYPISTPVTGSDIVIGSITGSGGDTANFLMSGIANYMTGQISLANVCSVGSTTATTMDIGDTLTLSKASGTGLAVTANATIGGRLTITGTGLGNGLVVSGDGSVGGTFGVVGITTLTGALDANSTADIADTLTLSKATGTGLSVTANVNINGDIECYGLHHQWGALTVEGITTLNNSIDANSTADIADTLTLSKATGTGLQVDAAANIDGTLEVAGVTTLTGALDANSTADIANTLTLSKPTGTGLQVDANANIDGRLDVAGNAIFTAYLESSGVLKVTGAVPAASTSSGSAGSVAIDATHIYVCTATNTWGRVAIDMTPF